MPDPSGPAVSDPSGLVKFDRRNRPFMGMGPLWWWLLALPILFGLVLLVLSLPVERTPRRWLGLACGLAMLSWVVAYFWLFIRRLQAYRRELKRRGLRHAIAVPDDTAHP